MAGRYPHFVKTQLAGVNQIDYLTGKTDKSARETFIYYSGATLSAVRYKNWKFYYSMAQPGPEGWILPLTTFNFTLVQNIKRDPFEQAVGVEQKSALSLGGCSPHRPPPSSTIGTSFPSVRDRAASSGEFRGVSADAGAPLLQPGPGDGADPGAEARDPHLGSSQRIARPD